MKIKHWKIFLQDWTKYNSKIFSHGKNITSDSLHRIQFKSDSIMSYRYGSITEIYNLPQPVNFELHNVIIYSLANFYLNKND